MRTKEALLAQNEDRFRRLVDSVQEGWRLREDDFEQFHHAARQLSLYWLMLNEGPPAPSGV
jgi:hypothetical protein